MAMPITVLISVSASAPAPRAAPAISTRSVTFGLSLAQRGRRQAAAAATASAVADAEWANIRRRYSTLGQLTFTSTAITSAPALASMVAAFWYASTVKHQMLATTREP